MLSPYLMTLALGATWVGDHGPLVGAVDFGMQVRSEANLAIVDHELGGGVVAYAGTYTEIHTAEMRTESTEMLAYRDDRVDFETHGSLIARRYRHDRWPTPIEAYAKK